MISLFERAMRRDTRALVNMLNTVTSYFFFSRFDQSHPRLLLFVMLMRHVITLELFSLFAPGAMFMLSLWLSSTRISYAIRYAATPPSLIALAATDIVAT